MALDPSQIRAVRGAVRHNATRIVALRHTSRVAARPQPRSRLPRVVGGLVLGLGLTTVIVVGLAAVMLTTAVGVLSVDLPAASQLEALTFSQPTVVYDRTGTVELGRFQREQRRVVAFGDVPKLVLDATTSAEDRTFWANSGFDAAAIVSAVSQGASGGRERGASTITQQLVRARLLPAEATQAGADRYLRKAKEIIQSMRVAETFPGEIGKDRVIAAYLNEIFYGHGAYGVAAAAWVYFGVSDLAKLTRGQAALLAGLPKSPTTLDPYRYAVKDKNGRLVVPRDAAPVVRRDWVLGGLAQGARWTTLTPSELQAARDEPVILAGERALMLKAPHFTWQVRRQLESILGGADKVETGGYKVITTLDPKAQDLAEKWLTAGAIVPNLSYKKGEALLKTLKIPKGDRSWIRALRGKDLHNGALVALDYRTGDVLAYAGSAGYYRDDLTSPKFSPKYDVAGDGSRQPGSAFKPILYAAAFDSHKLTPGSLLLDVTTKFNVRENWAPRDADQLERGPVLVRKALQYSLNIPAIRALQRVGNDQVDKTAEALGLRFSGGRQAYLQSGLAGALGTVEVRPVDLTSAFGTLANGGVHVPPRTILEIDGPDGHVVWKAPELQGTAAVSPGAAFLVSDILAGNTDKKQNPIWSAALAVYNGKGGARRPAAVKTGTSNDARDLATYGFLALPKDDHPALAVGVWMGNSDHSNPRARKPAISLTAAAPLWHAFVRDYTRNWPVTNFTRPKGLVEATIDAWSGGKPGPWTKDTTTAWFIAGTQPGARRAIDPDGLLYSQTCGSYRVDLVKAELGPASWDADVATWMSRARGGPGRIGPYDSRTAYFWKQSSWGGRIAGACYTPRPRHQPGQGGGKHGGKHVKPPGGGGGLPLPTPPPAPTPAP
ncbi:MAG: transglycosylase domain-containing protein [Chloroflexota bacterium]